MNISTFDDDEQDTTDLLLESFSDPVKLGKRKINQEGKKVKRQRANVSSGKELADEKFNQPLTLLDYKNLKQNIISEPHRSVVEKYLSTTHWSEIPYESKTKTIGDEARSEGLYYVYEFILCASCCSKWLQERLTSIGWRVNMTGYDPVSNSHSPPELLSSTVECFKMACKQMIRFLEWDERS